MQRPGCASLNGLICRSCPESSTSLIKAAAGKSRPGQRKKVLPYRSGHLPPAESVRAVPTPLITAARPATETVQQHYLREHFAYIRDLLRKRLVYPPLARKMGWGGRAVVTFMILEDGSVEKIRVTESCGFPLLDKCALETVMSCGPVSTTACKG